MTPAERELRQHNAEMAKSLELASHHVATLLHRVELLTLEARALDSKPDPLPGPETFLHRKLALNRIEALLTEVWNAIDAARRSASLATRVGKRPEDP